MNSQFNCFQSLNLSPKRHRFCNKRSCLCPSVSASINNPHQRNIFVFNPSVKWDDKGLAVAIAQHVDTGAVLMQGFANRDALASTISSKKATFYSRSRLKLWTKGKTSMNYINICNVFLDCDRDSILYLGKPDGPSCHTGSETCYYTSVFDSLYSSQAEENNLAMTTLQSLEATIVQRKAEISESSTAKPSWTRRLLLDNKLLCSKIREEADELCRSLEDSNTTDCIRNG